MRHFLFHTNRDMTLQIPVGIAYFGIVVGCCVMVVHLLASLFQGGTGVGLTEFE